VATNRNGKSVSLRLRASGAFVFFDNLGKLEKDERTNKRWTRYRVIPCMMALSRSSKCEKNDNEYVVES
jgi:hypothetical protein